MMMRDVLGTHPVCTDPATCPKAKSSPAPLGEQWHHAIGHWVEDDPKVGDGSFSSAGKFGFYPWIDHDELYYGILPRRGQGDSERDGVRSTDCGRDIRKAWLNGSAD
jgi:hypothetical protein